MSDVIRCGVIGYGLFGAHHAKAFAAASGGELVAIAVPSDASRAAAIAAHAGAAVYADYRQLLERADIDAVSIVVPNVLHFEIAAAALAAGKHVLLEKPMALSVAHGRELIRLAADKRRVLAIGHELRLSSLWAGAKRLIDEGAIGQPRYALVELSRFPYRQGSGGWRYDSARVGSWILEEPIHFFDLARWYLSSCGEPESVYARANSAEMSDNFVATVNFPCGAFAVIAQTLSAFGHHQTAKIAGDRGTIWAAWSAADARSDRPTFSLCYGRGSEVNELQLTKPAGELLELADEVAAFIDCVRCGTPPPCTGEDGLRSTQLCLAAAQSIATGQVTAVSDQC
jgi:myo-inositol 2-dehydrogenase / D-chiro-inositol 1-dehydrogenase